MQEVHGGDPVRVTEAKDRDIHAFLWTANDRLAYFQDKGGDENFRLFAVDADGKNAKALTDFDKVRTDLVDDLSELDDNHGEILVGLNKRDPKVFDVYRVNTHTGELTMVAQNPGNIDSWITDHQGRVRAAVTATELTRACSIARKKATSSKPC